MSRHGPEADRVRESMSGFGGATLVTAIDSEMVRVRRSPASTLIRVGYPNQSSNPVDPGGIRLQQLRSKAALPGLVIRVPVDQRQGGGNAWSGAARRSRSCGMRKNELRPQIIEEA